LLLWKFERFGLATALTPSATAWSTALFVGAAQAQNAAAQFAADRFGRVADALVQALDAGLRIQIEVAVTDDDALASGEPAAAMPLMASAATDNRDLIDFIVLSL
jgi:hypothetical protein